MFYDNDDSNLFTTDNVEAHLSGIRNVFDQIGAKIDKN